jgi:hypothetical protein
MKLRELMHVIRIVQIVCKYVMKFQIVCEYVMKLRERMHVSRTRSVPGADACV